MGATPLPWMKVRRCARGAAGSHAQVIIVGAVVFADTFGSLVIFPFLPFMVHDFFPSTPTDQLGMPW